MISKEVYRIKKGTITSDELIIPFEFGIVFSDDGLIRLDLYIEENFDLSEIVEGKREEYFDKYFYSKCITEDYNELEFERLSFTNIIPHLSKAKMVCYGRMIHRKIEEKREKANYENTRLYYLELEGLKMEFSDITEQIRARGGRKIEDFNNWQRDHTSAVLLVDKHPYNQLFYKSENANNIIVEFPNESNNTFTYKRFHEVRKNYISILSFLNGAEVRIRKEYTGSFYSVGKVNSEVVITHSFQTVNNVRFNDYIPLNHAFSRSDGILNKFFLFSFDNYCNWNDKIDLNSIVFYLSNSEQTKSIEEKVFIQMIAFERLTTKYAEYLGKTEEFLPNNEEFEPIKQEFFKVLDRYKDKCGKAYNTIKSKIANVNQIKRLSTTDKMYRIINDCNIPVDSSIENLIDIVRHKTIHKGDIGDGKEGIKNFYLLDELIREIILRLVEYKGKRLSRILLSKDKSSFVN